MALLPYIDEKNASPEVLEVFGKRSRVLNVLRIQANAQRVFIHRNRLSTALLTEATLSPKLREMTILRTAKNCRCVYVWTQHVPAAKHVGVTDEQIAAIENWQSAKCFSQLERLVLRFADEVNANVKGSRETVEELKKHLSPGEIVELLYVIGQWRQTATITETLEIELEDFAGKFNVLEETQPAKK
jgi:AhpD family alkylhydroperoxidase